MSENRVYPRIQSDWKLYLERPEGKQEVGYQRYFPNRGFAALYERVWPAAGETSFYP
jgi:hypothetical protein